MSASVTAATSCWTGRAWSCAVRLVVDDPRALRPAVQDLCALLDRVDAAASRFRADSDLQRANRQAGRPVPVPALLVDLVDAALYAAQDTDGAVDPTLGRVLHHLGYDRDIDDVRDTDRASGPVRAQHRAAAWRAVRLDRQFGLLTVPVGVALDLGATAKAWTADRAASVLAARYGTATLVELGGDLAVAGERPGGWLVRVAEAEGGDGEVVTLRSGGLATSTTTLRRWRTGGSPMHHLIDPRTNRPAAGPWRTATVAAGSALQANTASTAAIVAGDAAPAWLTERGLAARLVRQDGAVTTTAGWPAVERGLETVSAAATGAQR